MTAIMVSYPLSGRETSLISKNAGSNGFRLQWKAIVSVKTNAVIVKPRAG